MKKNSHWQQKNTKRILNAAQPSASSCIGHSFFFTGRFGISVLSGFPDNHPLWQENFSKLTLQSHARPATLPEKSIEQRLLQVPKTVQQGWTVARAPFKRSAFAKDRRNQTSLLPFCWYLLRLWFAFAGSISGRTWMQCSDKKNFLLWWFYRKSESTKKSLHMAERNKKVLYEVKRFFYGFPAQAQDFSL